MSSSTSSSSARAAPSPAPGWRRWLVLLAAVMFGGTALIYLAIILLDPFATGRLTPFKHFEITTEKRMLGHAGRVRNPAFDAAIIGNSRAFGIEPARLSQATGRRFVHLTLEAAYPDDQFRMLRVFAAAHAGTSPLLVHVVDAETWCEPGRGRTLYQVPWWLYEGSNLQYLRNILSMESAAAALRRALSLLGRADRERVGFRPDGYALWPTRNALQLRQEMLQMQPPVTAAPGNAPFPNLDDLSQSLQDIDRASAVVLLMPPVFASALPAAGSRAEARLAECKRRLDAIARARPNTAFVDARRESAQVRDPDNFLDATHYLDPVAIPVERELAAAIGKLGAAR